MVSEGKIKFLGNSKILFYLTLKKRKFNLKVSIVRVGSSNS